MIDSCGAFIIHGRFWTYLKPTSLTFQMFNLLSMCLCIFLQRDTPFRLHSAGVSLLGGEKHRQLTDSLEYKPLIRKASYSCQSLKTLLLVLLIRKTEALSSIHRGLCRWIIYPVAITDTGILLVLFYFAVNHSCSSLQPTNLSAALESSEHGQ